MATPAQNKWDNIYRDAVVSEQQRCLLLREYGYLLPTQGKALDLACGLGGNAIALAKHGLETDAWDISPVAIDKLNDYAQTNGLKIHGRSCDVPNADFGNENYDVILIAHYLERDLAPKIQQALKPGGLLCYQTFVRDVTADYSGPSNPDFRLHRGELLQLFNDLQPIVYHDEGTLGDITKGIRNLSVLIAQKS